MTSTSEIHVQGTSNDPAVQARAVLQDRDDELLAELAAKTALVVDLHLEPVAREAAQDSLVRFCLQRVLPHLEMVDRAVYAVAAGAAETRLLVRALRALHVLVADAIDGVNRAESSGELAAAAHATAAVLGARNEVDHAVLLPALATMPGVDLPTLAQDIATLRGGGSLAAPDLLDVRKIPHGQRHPRIFGTYARLAPGQSFVLINNHDPKPLRQEFDTVYPGQYSWEYLETGPAQWQVRIGHAG
ncbi:MAG: hypothetical protein ABS81_10820 [Pseudonocardia sp. SCN 72-86]|mgnify:CR=1 FL=1|nr:MAG: hypothetical protein ABS81_10820 [Pseudonocardia sp. SCN 72-86]